jgi:hypothetical protein
MKITFPTLFLAVFLLGGMSLRAEDWTTIDGKVYPQIKVIKVETDAVTILYRDGGALIPLIMLPDDLQKKFHYNAALAKAAADARDQADFENARALRAEQQQLAARKQALLHAMELTAESPKTTGIDIVTATSSDSSHHSISELADSIHNLQDDGSSGTHYTINNVATLAPLSVPPGNANHYSMGSIFGSSDPLNQ